MYSFLLDAEKDRQKKWEGKYDGVSANMRVGLPLNASELTADT